jgi:hypothetical protein
MRLSILTLLATITAALALPANDVVSIFTIQPLFYITENPY